MMFYIVHALNMYFYIEIIKLRTVNLTYSNSGVFISNVKAVQPPTRFNIVEIIPPSLLPVRTCVAERSETVIRSRDKEPQVSFYKKKNCTGYFSSLWPSVT